MSKHGHGFGSSRAETLAVCPDGATQVRRQECATCAKETLFKGLKCLSCGTFRKVLNAKGEIIDYGLTAVRKFHYKRRKGIRRWITSLRNDKANYYKQKAAESRAKFEGVK